ncbi:MAG: AraC family transcriptional regulator [Myxococcales bacterium]|nr:AraC family transcriptional regulator [Myxococcales bacterium]
MSTRHRATLDPLHEVLHDLRLRDSFYCRSELTAPWGLRFPQADHANFHFVADGRCCVRAGETTLALEAGDLVLLPHGHGHELVDEPASPTVPATSLPHERIGKRAALLQHGGGGEAALILCGGVRFEPHPLLELLPEVLRVGAGDGEAQEWTERILQLMAGEVAGARPGSETVITRLADLLVIGAIRTWVSDGAERRGGWLGALHDEQIGRALALMHRETEAPWSVQSLAAKVHMSRASFAERFTSLVGVPPMQYLTRRRMQVASGWIRDERLAVGEVAERLGYRSEASFSRAFKRVMGVPPGSLRRSVDPRGSSTAR